MKIIICLLVLIFLGSCETRKVAVFLDEEYSTVKLGSRMCISARLYGEHLFNASLYRNSKIVGKCSTTVDCHIDDTAWVAGNKYSVRIYPTSIDLEYITVSIDYVTPVCGSLVFYWCTPIILIGLVIIYSICHAIICFIVETLRAFYRRVNLDIVNEDRPPSKKSSNKYIKSLKEDKENLLTNTERDNV